MTRSRRMTRREALLWCAAACVPVIVGLARFDGPALSEDSYQYLSAAENLVGGKGLKTSILHYDLDRSRGVLPAPFSHWPPGYPIAIAGLHVLGLPADAAAALVSGAAFVILVPLLIAAARSLDLRPWPTRLLLIWLLTNSWSFRFPSAGTSESLFTALASAGVMLLIPAPVSGRAAVRSWRLIAPGVLIGLASWVRFAGAIVAIAVAVPLGALWLARRDRRSLQLFVFAVGPAAVLIALNALRTFWISGSWWAGHDSQALRGVTALARPFAASIHHLFLGDAVASRLGPAEGLLTLSAISIVGAAVWAKRRSPSAPVGLARGPIVVLVATIAVYCAGMIGVARSSTITFDARMFYPILPLALLGFAALTGGIANQVAGVGFGRMLIVGALFVATMCYVTINLRSILATTALPPHVVVARRLAGPLRDWITTNIPPGAPLVASDGQPTGYVLRRPTVSLAYSAFSNTVWSEEVVRDTMTTFGAQFLVLYATDDSAQDPVQRESRFLSAVLQGSVPAWLELAAENKETRVFRRR